MTTKIPEALLRISRMYGGMCRKYHTEEEFYKGYSQMPRVDIFDAREHFAVKPDEHYRLGDNPQRELRLKVLTKLLMEDSPGI